MLRSGKRNFSFKKVYFDPVECSNDNDLFTCLGGQCLPHGLQCDGIKDCEDGSDEIQLCGEILYFTVLVLYGILGCFGPHYDGNILYV